MYIKNISWIRRGGISVRLTDMLLIRKMKSTIIVLMIIILAMIFRVSVDLFNKTFVVDIGVEVEVSS